MPIASDECSLHKAVMDEMSFTELGFPGLAYVLGRMRQTTTIGLPLPANEQSHEVEKMV
jgi:hypothetical protein